MIRDRFRDIPKICIALQRRTVLSSVYAGGDYGRLMEGVFENYLDVKFKDMHLENVSGWE